MHVLSPWIVKRVKPGVIESDLLPLMPSFINCSCSGFGSGLTGLQIRFVLVHRRIISQERFFIEIDCAVGYKYGHSEHLSAQYFSIRRDIIKQ